MNNLKSPHPHKDITTIECTVESLLMREEKTVQIKHTYFVYRNLAREEVWRLLSQKRKWSRPDENILAEKFPSSEACRKTKQPFK